MQAMALGVQWWKTARRLEGRAPRRGKAALMESTIEPNANPWLRGGPWGPTDVHNSLSLLAFQPRLVFFFFCSG
jgi:hypothetical protein